MKKITGEETPEPEKVYGAAYRTTSRYSRRESLRPCVVCGLLVYGYGYHVHKECLERYQEDHLIFPSVGGYSVGAGETGYATKRWGPGALLDDEETCEEQEVRWGMAHDKLPTLHLGRLRDRRRLWASDWVRGGRSSSG